MDMELSSSYGESTNRSKRKKRPKELSSSSDEDSVDVKDEPLDNEVYDSTTETEDSNFHSSEEEDEEDTEWQKIRSPTASQYSEEEKLLIESVDCNNPFALFKVFFTDHIAGIIVEETNKYAEQYLNSFSSRRKHQKTWQPITRGEINTFFGILLIMGVVQLPKIRLYWCKKTMYMNTCIKKSMLRDRFLSILKYLHFPDNTLGQMEDQLDKIRNIVDIIFLHNNKKMEVDLSDQLSSYYTCLWKTVKWYQKMIIQLICETCITNAWYMNQRWGTNNINILKFREQIINQLLTNVDDIKKMNAEPPPILNKDSHFLEQYKEPPSKSRKRCKQCYKRLSKEKGRVHATRTAKKVTTYCNTCKGQPALCFECFKELHS